MPDGPTATTGCILGQTHAVWVDDLELAESSPPLELDDSFRPYIRKPLLIELRIDGAPSTIRYVDSWKVCGLPPGHHVIEMDTARGPLRCEGDARAGEMLTLEATSFGAMLHIEPMRLVAGAPLPMRRLIVEYDELNVAPLAPPRPRHDDFPSSAILRIWKTPDGVLHAERCPSRPTEQPPAPRTVPASGCAHCSVGTGYRSQSLVVTLFVLLLVVMKRRR